MNQRDAADLIRGGLNNITRVESWADLGCGSGTFTLALASMLYQGSTVYAVDKDRAVIKALPEVFNSNFINKTPLHFINDILPFESVEGILMANSLHYVKDKSSFLEKVVNTIRSDGKLIIIEYEALRSNYMVPYPIQRKELISLLISHQLDDCRLLGERPSRFGHTIYSIGTMKL